MPDSHTVVVTGTPSTFKKLEAEAMARSGKKTAGATPEEATAFWQELAEQGAIPLEELSNSEPMGKK